ncbi:hypothetical protein HSE2_gp037 [Escherichia phage vB_EcoS_HSE2]|nr:hypothetical protein HSE2_gp037 [Escherichia phage vB_EcoS_HSE2]
MSPGRWNPGHPDLHVKNKLFQHARQLFQNIPHVILQHEHFQPQLPHTFGVLNVDSQILVRVATWRRQFARRLHHRRIRGWNWRLRRRGT